MRIITTNFRTYIEVEGDKKMIPKRYVTIADRLCKHLTKGVRMTQKERFFAEVFLLMKNKLSKYEIEYLSKDTPLDVVMVKTKFPESDRYEIRFKNSEKRMKCPSFLYRFMPSNETLNYQQ